MQNKATLQKQILDRHQSSGELYSLTVEVVIIDQKTTVLAMAAAVDIDFESARLAIQLERHDILEDLDRTINPTLTIAQEEGLRSRLLAIESHDVELQQANARYAGQRLQQSMYHAMLTDTRAIAVSRREEQQAVEDRAEAARLSGEAAPPVPPQVHQQQQGADYENERLAEIEEMLNNTAPSSVDHSSTLAGDDDVGSELTLVDGNVGVEVNLAQYMNALRVDEHAPELECMVCANTFRGSQTVTLPCGDAWCRRCLSRRFEESIVDESAWPPKCCREEIMLQTAFQLLPTAVRVRFVLKSVEWSTPNRTYCHDRRCSTFIPPDRIQGRRADCPQCDESSCAECKGTYHGRRRCPEVATEEDRMLEQMAQTNGWPRCPSCRRYVEITHGCNHMT